MQSYPTAQSAFNKATGSECNSLTSVAEMQNPQIFNGRYSYLLFYIMMLQAYYEPMSEDARTVGGASQS
jgi:hypothetical protein